MGSAFPECKVFTIFLPLGKISYFPNFPLSELSSFPFWLRLVPLPLFCSQIRSLQVVVPNSLQLHWCQWRFVVGLDLRPMQSPCYPFWLASSKTIGSALCAFCELCFLCRDAQWTFTRLGPSFFTSISLHFYLPYHSPLSSYYQSIQFNSSAKTSQ